MSKQQLILDLEVDGEGRVKLAMAGVANSTKKASQEMNKASKNAQLLGKAMKALGLTATAATVLRLGQAIFTTSEKMRALNLSFEAITGSVNLGRREMQFVRAEAERLGLVYTDLAGAYRGMLAAAQGTNLQGEQTRRIFSAIAENARVLGLSMEETRGALYAVQQMMSKGVVSAEELRQQLGERMPNALQAVIRASGMSTKEFYKMLESGQILAEDLLPRMAEEMHKLAASGVAAASSLPTAEINRFRSALEETASVISDSGLGQSVADFAVIGAFALQQLNDSIKSAQDSVIGQADAVIRSANPISIFATQIRKLRAEQQKLAEQTQKSTDAVNTQGGAAQRVGQQLQQAFGEFFSQNQKSADQWLQSARERNAQLEAEIENVGKSEEKIIAWQAAMMMATTVNEEQRAAIEQEARALIANVRALKKAQEAEKQRTEELEKQKTAQEELNAVLQQMQSVLDPMAALEAERNERIALLNEAMPEASRNSAEYAEKLALINQYYDEQADRLREAASKTQAQNAAVEEYDYALQSLLQQLGLIDPIAAQAFDAMWLLNLAFDEGKISADEYAAAVARLAQQTERLQQAKYRSEHGYLGSLTTGGGLGRILSGDGSNEDLRDLSTAIQNLGQAVDGMRQRAAAGQDTAGNLLQTGADLAASGAFGPVGTVIGQALNFINDLTRGGLFGTGWYGLNSGTRFSVGPDGASGETWQERKRRLSFFRGSETRIDTQPLDDQAQQFVDDLLNAIVDMMTSAAEQLGVEVAQMVEGTFQQEFDRNGDLVSQYGTINGRRYDEDQQTFSTRLIAENLIAQVGAAMPQIAQELTYFVQDAIDPSLFLPETVTVYTNEASQIAERWRGDAEQLLDGAKMMLAAQTAIVQGNALLGDSLLETVDFVESMQGAGESLSDTFERLYQSTNLLQQALDAMGISLDMGREQFVTFAADIAQAAGGVEQAQALWSSYFEFFYSESERQQASLQQLGQSAAEALNALGLNSGISPEEFRRRFEEALPTLTPEEIAQWLEAGRALGLFTQAMDEVGAAVQKYEEFMLNVRTAAIELGNSDFQNTLLAIRDAERENIATANELARAAGMQGAAEDDLAAIHQLAARQAAQAIAQLRQASQSLVQQLGYDELSSIEAKIAELESSQTTSISNVGQAADNMYQRQLDAIARIQDYVDSLLLNDALSPLTPQQKLDEAQAQYMSTLLAAQAGDVDAMAALPNAAQSYLEAARFMFASNDEYQRIFSQVTSALQGISPTAKPQTEGRVIGTAAGRVISGELRALYEERDRIQAEREAAQRAELASQLAQNIADLAYATGETFQEVMTGLGVDIAALAADLGMEPDDLLPYLAGLTPDMDEQLLTLQSVDSNVALQTEYLRAIMLGIDRLNGGEVKPEPRPKDGEKVAAEITAMRREFAEVGKSLVNEAARNRELMASMEREFERLRRAYERALEVAR